MTPTFLAIIGGLTASLLCFLIGGLTTYAGYVIFNKGQGRESSKLEIKLLGLEAKVGNVGGVIMISGLAWGVIGYTTLPNLDYSEDNGVARAMIRMSTEPRELKAEYELNLSPPNKFMESNVEIFGEIETSLHEFSSVSNPAKLEFTLNYKGSKDYSEESFVNDYLKPVMNFCDREHGSLCLVSFELSHGFEEADKSILFIPEKIILRVTYHET